MDADRVEMANLLIQLCLLSPFGKTGMVQAVGQGAQAKVK